MEVCVVRDQQKTMLSSVEEVKALRLLSTEKAGRNVSLEKQVDELEQYSRMNNFIVTGLGSDHDYQRRTK